MIEKIIFIHYVILDFKFDCTVVVGVEKGGGGVR